MNALINVVQAKIGEETVNAVNARDLHGFLEVGKDFSTWIKQRIGQYGFIEGQDFVTAENLRSPILGSAKSRPQIALEYHVSLDMAKELSMVERNEKGKQARQYFIDCERRANAQPTVTLPDFTNPAIAARAWAEQHEHAESHKAQSRLLIEKLSELLDEYRTVTEDDHPVAAKIQPHTSGHHPTPLIELLETISSSPEENLNITKHCKQIAAKHGTQWASLRAIFYRHLSGIANRQYFG